MGETEDHEPAGGPKRRFVPSSEKLEVPRSTEGSLAILLLQIAQNGSIFTCSGARTGSII